MNRSLLKKLAALLFPLALIGAGLFHTLKQEKEPEILTRNTFLLDTFCEISIYGGGGEQAMEAGLSELARLDGLFAPNRPESDLYKINHRTGSKVEVSPDTAALLRLGKEFCIRTEGALEPAIKPLTECWDFTDKKVLPDPDLLKERLTEVKSLAYDVREETDSAGVSHTYFTADDPAVRIDAGAFAKGFIADRIGEVLRERGVTSGIINLGGNLLLIGGKPDGSPFEVGIRADTRPDGSPGGYAAHFSLKSVSVVTAGTYERCFEQDGVRYHHILDPETGWPVQNGLVSVTVYGPESGVCDALTTSLFVMGEEKGKAFLSEYNRSTGANYEVFFLRKKSP